ncbi:MAG: hypothetical protein ABR585_12745 [Gemmatimonadaceae bacterium]
MAAVSTGVANASSSLKLHPDGFGPKSLAAWRAHEGEQDRTGNADQALYFQKFTATETNAAGVARITGLEGQPVSAIEGLSWEHRIDGWCGAGAPRWDIIVADENGNRGVIFLGCALAVHTPGSEPGWLKDTQPSTPAGALILPPATGFTTDFNPLSPLTIDELLIVFDEGTTYLGQPYGSGYTFLDNIQVNTKIWTSPADNGGN